MFTCLQTPSAKVDKYNIKINESESKPPNEEYLMEIISH